MTEEQNDYQSKAMQDLIAISRGTDKQRDRAAVNKLLSLNGGKPIADEKYPDPLLRQMIKNSGG